MTNPVQLLQYSGSNKLPMILQTEAAECGLACLAMVAQFHGHRVDMNTLRRRYPISLKGANLQSLMQTADQLHFATRALRLEIEEIEQLQCPCVLHWDLNHFVVLKKASKSAIILHDPAIGERRLSVAETSKHFSGIALELTPTKSFEKKDEEKRLRLSDLWCRITGLKRTMIQVLLLSFLLQAFVIVTPFYMQTVLDEVIVSRDVDLLLLLGLGFLCLKLIEVGVDALRALTLTYAGTQLNIQIAANLFRHMIHLPLSYFEKRHVGDIVSRFGSLDQIKSMLTNELIEGIVDGAMIIGTLVMMFLYSWTLSLVVLSAVALYVAIRLTLYPKLRRLTEENIIAKAKEDSNFMETVRAMQTIKLFGKEAQRQTVWQNRYADFMNTGIRLGKFEITYRSINRLIFGVENVAVIYMAAQQAMAGALSVGMIFAFVSYRRQFTEKAASLVDKAIQFRMLSLHLTRIADIALTPLETDTSDQTVKRRLMGSLQLSNVAFQYSASEPLLFENLRLNIRAGESVCFVGSSGCGKSTLLKIMLGLFEPTSGQVLVDGVDIRSIGVGHYRRQIASVMQDDQLLSGSIADNICFFDPNPKQERIEKCAKIAAIHDEIMAMPMGYASLIGDMGTSLSGGQKQRILLARALYKKPRILFMDEATSHLDSALEQVINRNIRALKITRVLIAHRQETIDSADRVIQLQNGRIRFVESPALRVVPSA